MLNFIIPTRRTFAAATVIGAFLMAAPLDVSFAQIADPAAVSTPTVAKHVDHLIEKRIDQLHDKLRITAAEEPLWADVAQAMRDNGQLIQSRMAERSAKLKTMTAVEDLKSYQAVADEHSESLRRLIPAFEKLYAGMPADQQKRADLVFAHHQRRAQI